MNERTSSGAELVAAALQEHKRAVIIGTPTFGIGTVQTIIPLSDGSAMTLTTARLYTPNGRSISETKVKPDIVVEDGDGGDSVLLRAVETLKALQRGST